MLVTMRWRLGSASSTTSTVESRVALPARLGQEVHVDLFFLQWSYEQTAQRCVHFWQYCWCDTTSGGQFVARNDRDALVASLGPLPNVTHASACKILAGTGPKPQKMVDGPNLSCNSLGGLLLSCFSVFAPVASAKIEGVMGNLIKFLLDPFYSPRGWFCVFFYKKRRRKRVFGRNVAWFWACNLLNEGVLKLCLENTCCKLVKMNFRWEICLS